MRQITIIIEDDKEGTTHVRFYESGNGSGETESEMGIAVKLRTVIVAFSNLVMGVGKIFGTTAKGEGKPERVPDDEDEIDPEIWNLFKDL